MTNNLIDEKKLILLKFTTYFNLEILKVSYGVVSYSDFLNPKLFKLILNLIQLILNLEYDTKKTTPLSRFLPEN